MSAALLRGVCVLGGVSILAFAAWAHFARVPDPTVRLATCMPNDCFCEAVSDGVPRQGSNTWSSIGFVLAGMVLCLTTGRLTEDGQRFTLLYALALYAVGVGSAYYHAVLTFSGQVVDVLGMYLIITSVICFERRKRWWGGSWLGAWIVLNCGGLVLQIGIPALRRYVFAAAAFTLLLDEGRRARGRDLRYLWISLGLFSVATVIWVLDITRIACQPTAIIQGHAVWHVLGAAASASLYVHAVQDA